MKWLRYIAVVFLTVIYSFCSISACINPIDNYSSGVLFNNNEGFFIDRFDSLGMQGVNFLKSCKMIKPDTSIKDVGILSPYINPIYWNDPVTVRNVAITNNIMEIDVSYVGGCTTHEFNLYALPELKESFPPIAEFTLCHNANNDACKALMDEKIFFNLSPFEMLNRNTFPIFINFSNNNPNIYLKTLWYPDNTCSVKYKSHFCSNAMVYLEFASIEGSGSHSFPSMRIVTDPNVEFFTQFDYGKTVAAELEWLLDNQIISGITTEVISKVENSIGTELGLYWTHQDTFLMHGTFFTYQKDSTTGEWKWGDATISVKNGCGSSVEFILPPDSLKGKKATDIRPEKVNRNHKTSLIQVRGRDVFINIKNSSLSNAFIEIVDLKGRLLSSEKVPQNKTSFQVQISRVISNGIYRMVLRSNQIKEARAIVISE